MTTQEKMSFEERLENIIYRHNELPSIYSGCIHNTLIRETAHWARKETIKEVLGLLSSQPCECSGGKYCECGALDFKIASNWIESKLAQSVHLELTDKTESEPKVIMKDEIYKTNGDE